jgi:hypothetical protein
MGMGVFVRRRYVADGDVVCDWMKERDETKA